MSGDYASFLVKKAQAGADDGFSPVWIPDFLFDFQKALLEWAVRKGRAALFADCGLGKTPMQLAWAENVVRHANGRVLILTPLAVAAQTMREGAKFGIEVYRAGGLLPKSGIIVTNYERLHHLDPADFAGVVCDESSILKSFDGVRRQAITQFMRRIPYRLLCTATAAPNDYVELGTSSEALGRLGHMDMLNRFFKNDLDNSATGRYCGKAIQWRFKGHAEEPFWRWVASWARVARRPSDLGFDDGAFVLPPMHSEEHVIHTNEAAPGMLMPLIAVGMDEEREETKRTIAERCAKVATLVANTNDPALIWCNRNEEGRLLAKIPGAVEVSGGDPDEAKEEKFLAFADGQARVLVTKPRIGAFGLNFQHCAHVTFFPSHSFEQFYQGVRRCWRFGQKRPVKVDIVAGEGGRGILDNLNRKAAAADRMFDRLVANMNQAVDLRALTRGAAIVKAPAWL